MIDPHHRADLVTVRETITQAGRGYEADLGAAASLLDGVLVERGRRRMRGEHAMGEETRDSIVFARERITRAAQGYRLIELQSVARIIDRVLKETCPHDPVGWYTTPDAKSGRQLTTCPACGVSWYEPA